MTNKMVKIENKGTITSLELLRQINTFRREEGKRTELKHNDLLKVTRGEFEDEIREGKVSQSYYTRNTGNGTIRKYPMFILTLSQAKQILVRESKFVRRAIIQYIEKLEQELSSDDISCNELIYESIKGFLIKGKVGITAISSRKLWIKLGVKTYFTEWMKRRIKRYEYRRGIDYIYYARDYMLTLEMACELCAIENKTIGRNVRKYLIDYADKSRSKNTLIDDEKIELLEKREEDLYDLLNTIWLKFNNQRAKAREYERIIDIKFGIAGDIMRANKKLIEKLK